MFSLNLKPAHQAVKAYYDELQTLGHLDFYTEGSVSPAFAALLRHCAKQSRLTLVEQYPLKKNSHALRLDGALLDNFRLAHGYWEAKDTQDDLEKEIQKKFDAGYPRDNILFQAPHRAIIYQDGRPYFDEDISRPEALVEALQNFFAYQPPHFEEWQKAVAEFKDRLPQHAGILKDLIEAAYHTNQTFIQAFDDFAGLCRQALNPNLSDAAVEEMIIQHILTERIFRKIFDNPDFVKRNIIAHEIDRVIEALTSQSFSREGFLRKLDRFYHAIETTAAGIEDYSQKQGFLNTVYERFFQGYSVKVADTHGIVYTPQPIVDFMVRSVDHLLRTEFGRSLADPGVHLLDPFVGTGNFIVRLMREIPKTRLAPKYAHELHCNEVMLLPYYIASMNIEHAFFEMTGTYQSFEGLCLADTFELAEAKQPSLFTEKNLERVERQRQTPIFVVLGNPPYNAGQINENDNNKNRKYRAMDGRVSETYARDSKATNRVALSDMYVKAIRWASDRIIKNGEGIVALVTNNSFTDQTAFDGMRKHLAQDFDAIYVLDLGGNVRKNPKLSGTTHNVFGIQVGVSISFFIRKKDHASEPAHIFYAAVGEDWRKEEKYDFLERHADFSKITWQYVIPDRRYNWLNEGIIDEYEKFLSMRIVGTKKSKQLNINAIFNELAMGVSTARNIIVYDFNRLNLKTRIKKLINDYNGEIARYILLGKPTDIDNFVDYSKIQWSSSLKSFLKQGKSTKFDDNSFRECIYRPYTNKILYYDEIFIHRISLFKKLFPKPDVKFGNKLICVPNIGGRSAFWAFCVNKIVDYDLTTINTTQCFPFYIYSEDGSQRRENLTDWALQQFRDHYRADAIAKWDIFHYIYALLHHPAYREKYAANLRRELPRIPFAPDFWAFARAGARLAELHVHYEQQPEYPLKWVEKEGTPLNWQVDKMKLTPDQTGLIYNNFLTLEGIPPQTFAYKLGNRSALEWVIDQYKVSTDKRSGLTNDPNRPDDDQYIVRLIGQVITVSLETLKIIDQLPPLE